MSEMQQKEKNSSQFELWIADFHEVKEWLLISKNFMDRRDYRRAR
jgi:hypothetical protein